ncbi:hypothetical protein HHI36_018210 [Cryptolaemus montrouzieri]|uniref:Uncharacterized protein n=1 Tax=Cryptolaemus montrouzieri TaxID=559131 RepID=A0ABD2NZN9_9CUCU
MRRQKFFEDEEAQENEESESGEVCGHESEYSDATDASSGSDEDMENATLDKRLLESRARGRPSSTSKGKDGFKWKTKFPERRSGKYHKYIKRIVERKMVRAMGKREIVEKVQRGGHFAP